jgi:RNA polymerase sigma factor (sigma-70 family)
MSMQTYLAPTKRRSDLTDDDLVQKAQIGDPGAFEILFERYSALLFLLIFRMVRDEHLAHDVLQHVFIQLYRSLPTLVPGETLRAWLSRVARHRSIDELRRRRHLLFSEIEPFPDGGEYSFLATLPDPDRQPEEQVELHELRQRLLDAIETLPSRYRAVVLLRYTDQLSFREIGRALSIPASTAKTYFYRASKQLRSLLGSEFAYY